VTDQRPACLITSTVTDYREEPFRLLAEAENVEVIAWAQVEEAEAAQVEEAGASVEQAHLDHFTLRRSTQPGAARLAASGRYRAVIAGLGGRVALPGAYAGARRAGVPFILWASLWAHPRTPAHTLSYLPMRLLYRRADAVVTYGTHVSDYVAARRGSHERVFEAPQAVAPSQFAVDVPTAARLAARERAGAAGDQVLVLFVGRLRPEKGVAVLLDAWRSAELGGAAVLAIAGKGPLHEAVERAGGGVRPLGFVARPDLPALYAAADVLVLPSIRTATFTEPWGLVVNEAMHQGTPIIATDAVGAVAGCLVRDDRNGLVVANSDRDSLAIALRSLVHDGERRRRLGAAARRDIEVFTPAAWVEGVQRALSAVGASNSGRSC